MALVFSMVSQSDALSLRLTCARRAQQIARGALDARTAHVHGCLGRNRDPLVDAFVGQLHRRSVDARWTMDEASLPLRALTAPYALS